MSGQRQKNRPEQGVLAFPAESRSDAPTAVAKGLRFEYDLMTKLLEAFDVITGYNGQTLGFEAIEEVTAQINVAGSVFQKVKGERGQES